MAPPLSTTSFSTLILLLSFTASPSPVAAANNWCVARSDATNQALQTALNYACAAGADCAPIQSQGLCFLPNTIEAHASYAFNSYFQRRSMAPGSCDFSGTATIARTDPSYGSCVYPSSLSTAGGAIPGTTLSTPTNPNVLTPPLNNGGVVPGLNPNGTSSMLPPGFGPGPEVDKATLRCTTVLVPVIALFVVSLLTY